MIWSTPYNFPRGPKPLTAMRVHKTHTYNKQHGFVAATGGKMTFTLRNSKQQFVLLNVTIRTRQIAFTIFHIQE